MCNVLEVSVSGYRDHYIRQQTQAQPTPHSQRLSTPTLLSLIRIEHAQSKGEYGAYKIWRSLKNKGYSVGKERVRLLMKKHGIRAKHKRKYIVTTDSKHLLPIAPNRLMRDFSANEPNQVWTTDITYIATDEGWMYLSVMLDLFSRRVVGYSMQPHMQSSLVVDALRMAWFARRPQAGLIVHSDRGSQYCGELFQNQLKVYNMQSSMSRKGDCWDNAPTESLWGHLKVGRLYGMRFKTGRDAKDEVMQWLGFYNHSRLHATLGYISPMQFEKNWVSRPPDNQLKAA